MWRTERNIRNGMCGAIDRMRNVKRGREREQKTKQREEDREGREEENVRKRTKHQKGMCTQRGGTCTPFSMRVFKGVTLPTNKG